MLRTLRDHDGMCKDYIPSAKYKRTFVFHDRNGLIQLHSKKDARADEKGSLWDVTQHHTRFGLDESGA